MRISTLLRLTLGLKGHRVKTARLDDGEIVAEFASKKRSRPICSSCGKKMPGYDTLKERTWGHVPLWGIPVRLKYSPRRGKCKRCGVTVEQGRLPVTLVKRDGEMIGSNIDKVFCYRGLEREEVDIAIAGDIVALTGVPDAHIGETIADRDNPEALPVIDIEPPTISAYLGPNTSPMKGREGQFNSSRQIGERLRRELETNVSLRVEEEDLGFKVSGRGELHLSVLIETLRREGFEFEVGRPQVVTILDGNVMKEPVEELIVEISSEYMGVVSQELGSRRANLIRQDQTGNGTIRITYMLPTRALIGLRNLLLTDTRGTVIMNSLPHGYQPMAPKLPKTRNGAIIATEAGVTTPYALKMCESRGELFVGPSAQVYQGMIVGLYQRKDDIRMNVCKTKHLTNMRSSSSDGTVQLTPFTDLSLEQCLDFIEEDELLEVTPRSLRLRKCILDPGQARRAARLSAI
jgi:GTP-binding protein